MCGVGSVERIKDRAGASQEERTMIVVKYPNGVINSTCPRREESDLDARKRIEAGGGTILGFGLNRDEALKRCVKAAPLVGLCLETDEKANDDFVRLLERLREESK